MRWLPSKTESQPTDQDKSWLYQVNLHLSIRDKERLILLRDRYDAGTLGGERDGELTEADYRRLNFLAWLRAHKRGYWDLSDERAAESLTVVLERIGR